MDRAAERREIREVAKSIMKNELHHDKVDLSRQERRKLAWDEAKNLVRDDKIGNGVRSDN